MSAKKYLHLLFLCGILCQEIFATLSDNDTRASSDVFVRKRRVISHLPRGIHGRVVSVIDEANYMVKIKEGSRPKCVGVILSHYTVITAAHCFSSRESNYKVLSGASYDNRCKVHTIKTKVEYNGNSPYQPFEGIALITVDPAFVYSRKTGNIQLYTGPLPVGTMATVYGWGHSYPPQPGRETRQRLHFIMLPTMNHRECQNDYRDHFLVTEKHICTYCEQQYCARNDEGAPLIVNNQLAGIHIFKGEYINQRNPDVFINFLRSNYSEWIREHTRLM